jgi:hypothetical protein
MQLNFEPIDLDGQQAYQQRLAQCSQIASDYSFINILGWAEEYGLQWAWHDALVCIKQTRPMEMLWAPVGDWQGADWDTMFAAAGENCPKFIRVPEMLLDIWKEQTNLPIRNITASRGHWDYLYGRQELIDLKGNRYHKKKNLVNQFRKKYDYTYLPFGDDLVTQAEELQEDWCTWRDCENSETLASENKAIAKVLENWELLDNITGGGLIVDQYLIAYTVAEVLPDNSLVIHFEKACPDIKGGYQAINQMFLSEDDSQCDMVNREQDIDDEGLRKAKLSYHPVGFVKKFQVDL